MDKDKIVAEMLTAKAEKNNTIDLDTYANGLADMYDRLVNLCNLPFVSVNEVAVCEDCMHWNKGEKLDICIRCFSNSHFDEQT